VVSVLPGHLLLEDARHIDRAGRPRKDRPDRRVGDGEGKISPRASTLCAAALGVRCVRPGKRPHRARRQSGGSDADPDYTTGCCAWHNNLVNEVGSLPYALTTRLHSPNGEPQTQFQGPRHRRVHQARGGILVQRETAF